MKHLSFEISFTNFPPFLKYWAARYPNGYDEKYYNRHFGNVDLNREDVLIDLFTWKNGGKIARRKVDSIRADYLKCWVEDTDLESRYLNPNKSGGPIWNIFYLHCRFPDQYPIYDQHTHRAMIYIQKHTICDERDDLNKKPRSFVYRSYREDYRPFVEVIRHKTGQKLRTIDRALFAYGQFLKRARPYWCPKSYSAS
jgi:hypothetical protein